MAKKLETNNENGRAQSTDGTLLIHEDFELGQYIHAFTSSSNRVRYVMIAITIAAMFIFAEFWNSRPKSWINTRINTARDALEVFEARRSGRDLPLPEFATIRNLENEEVIRLHLEQLEAAYVSRVVEPQIPALGLSFDLNDLGIFGGITLLLLLIMLTYSLDRQYENLFLSLWKVEVLYKREPKKRKPKKQEPKEDRESKANLLYHALAMAQVFTQPPTLARWRPSFVTRHVTKFLFFSPAGVHALVLWQNYATINYATSLKPKYPAFGMKIQITLLVLLLCFAIVCCVYSRACDERWRRIFFRINPSCAQERPRPWLERMMLPVKRMGPNW
jgi:hypothetical protein